MKFGNYPGISTADDYFAVLKSAFDTLYEEGEKGSPKMFSIGMHCRIIGRPGRFQGLKKFLDYISTFDGVWVAKREEIADHWLKTFPAKN
jgi:peptidoglycan/xylan/chitin deacetylase (PgdA/CDA1 family)